MNSKRNVTIVTISVVALLLCPATITASATTVTIQNAAEVAPNESTTLSIMIKDVAGVKGVHILLEYDSSVVNAVDIGNSDFGFESYKEINNVAGYVRFAVFNTLPLNGDIKFADVTLKRVSSGSSPLLLTVVALNNGSAEIPRVVVSGTLTETGEVSPRPGVTLTVPEPSPPTQVQSPLPSVDTSPTLEPTTSAQVPTPPTSEERATLTPEEPGFEGIVAVTSLLAIGYLALKKKKR